MDLNIFDRLGRELRTAFRRRNFDEIAFAELAESALGDFSFSFQWQPEVIAAFLRNSPVQQDPEGEFSNFPLVVYRCQEFYIEILVWTSGTTAIHEHSFSGAFKVLQGSSLHASYRFEAQEFINSRLASGRVSQTGADLLTAGDVRPIHPGADGLVHSLFHLENPSVTLVARTPGLSAYLPQMTLLPPHFAFSEADTDRDRLIKMYHKLLHTARDIDHGSFVKLLCEEIPQLDFLSLLVVTTGIYGMIPAGETGRFYTKVADGHGPELAEKLADTLEEVRRVDSLRAARRGTSDEELRFFLALLMNLRNRDDILRAIQQRYGDEDSIEACARLLHKLCSQKRESARLFASMATAAGISEYMLGSKLAGHLPKGLEGEDARDFFRDLLRSNVKTTDKLTRDIPELTDLFRQ